MAKTFPSIEAYCERYNIPLRVWTETDLAGRTFSPKFMVKDWLTEFVNSSAKWFCYLDADIIIHDEAPNIFDKVWEPGVYARVDVSKQHIRAFPGWFNKNFGAHVPRGYQYRNAGVYMMDKETAKEMLALIHPPYIEFLQEQHHINAWWAMMGDRLKVLPIEWNSAAGDFQEFGWFRHIMGKRKMEKIASYERAKDFLIPGQKRVWVPNLEAAVSKPGATRVIAIPIKRDGNAWKDGTVEEKELFYLLRSIEKYWNDKDIDVVLLAASRPKWASDQLKFRRCVSYQDALRAIPTLADEVVWFNDDTFLLKPTGWEDLFPIRRQGIINAGDMAKLKTSGNGWQRRLGRVTEKLHSMGVNPVYKFSTHTPYPYRADLMKETLAEFPLQYKTPVETAYFNMHRFPHQGCGDKITRYSDAAIPWELESGKYRFLNFNHNGIGMWMRGFLRGKFDQPSRFERPGAVNM